MKSKTVSSILRHVASKLPTGDSNDPTSPAGGPSESEIAAKRTRRQAVKAGEVEAGGVGAGGTGHGGVEGEEEKMEMLYETVAWPLSKTYGHPYDAFKLALT